MPIHPSVYPSSALCVRRSQRLLAGRRGGGSGLLARLGVGGTKVIYSQFYSIPHAGHLVQEDAPAILVSHLIKFFAE
jgi:hypothetical protein